MEEKLYCKETFSEEFIVSRYKYKPSCKANYLEKLKRINQELGDMRTVKYPSTHLLTEDEIYIESAVPEYNVIREHFFNEGRLELNVAIRIIQEAKALLCAESNILELEHPVTVAGDIHGQFYDLLTLFRVGGPPERTKYLFLGDYVDRGCFSCEVVLYLFALKINYPRNINLIRGNHECRHLTRQFTFLRECLYKYNDVFYDNCMDAFDCLPLAGLIDNEILCLHGGISPDVQTLKDIENIPRFCEPTYAGPMSDILWADPVMKIGEPTETTSGKPDFAFNSKRLCSYTFNFNALKEFLRKNQLISLIRAHEVQKTGFKIMKKIENVIPPLITVFSAPNYVDYYGNKAAIIEYNKSQIYIKQFSSVQHPYCLPKFQNGIDITLPFVIEKTIRIFITILKNCVEGCGINELMEPDEIKFLNDIKIKIRYYCQIVRQLSRLKFKRIFSLRKTAGQELSPSVMDLTSRYKNNDWGVTDLDISCSSDDDSDASANVFTSDQK